eukprot:TRINITY_DN2223_c0_g1_i2.p1 TRINITY_DN2223_c0_g1~~TRINITY_DN2223_c0_g1_i2.p1  ORF type:complete len:322 (-),score=131.71 TRINITY_DN2223_c0_g1_i2:50-1015(-)
MAEKGNEFSQERKNRLTAVFRTFDYDSSGCIECDEFLAIGKAVRGDEIWTEEKNAECMKRVDTDGDGKIDITEFISFFQMQGLADRSDRRFTALVNKYLAAAVAGRAKYNVANQTVVEGGDFVPESYKIKAEADLLAASNHGACMFAENQANKLKRREMYNRAAGYEKEYKTMETSLIRLRRQARAAGNYYAEPESKLMFVIRIRGMCDMHPKSKKILQLLRLRQIHLGVFLRVNKATQEMIKRVEPYIAYGYPSLKAVRSMVYKRGFGKLKTTGQAQRIKLTDNSAIEASLGEFGISSFEDLIHEIYTCLLYTSPSPRDS